MRPILLFAGVLLLIYGAATLGAGRAAGTEPRRPTSPARGVAYAAAGAVLLVVAVWLIVGG